MAATTHLDECLSIRGARLFIEERDTVELVRAFGSPLFVVSEDQLRRNVRRFQESFQQGWPDGPVKVLPAAKANWITAVQMVLASESCGCDIYSPGELTAALTAGFDPALISVNGVPKPEEHIRRAIEVGARLTIDGTEELDVIERVTRDLGKTAQIRLRLRPAVSGFTDSSDFVAEGRIPADLVALAYKGGLSFDEVVAVGRRALAMDRVEVVGFHEHHGRHSRSTRWWEEQMKAYAREMGRVSQALGGFQPKEIDIGGGFAVSRDPFNAATDYTAPLQLGLLYRFSKVLAAFGAARRYQVLDRLLERFATRLPNTIPAPPIEAYAEAVTRTLRRELPKHGIETRGVMLQLEPGRSLHANAGIHLATVRSIKETSAPIRWKNVLIDTTEFWFAGGRLEHHLHDYVVANKADAPKTGKADINGRSCYGDRLMPGIPVPPLEIGDVFAFLDTGAYQEVSASNFNAMPRPATLLVAGDRAEVIRRRETEEDVFRRDEIPARLRPGGQSEDLPARRPSLAKTAWD